MRLIWIIAMTLGLSMSGFCISGFSSEDERRFFFEVHDQHLTSDNPSSKAWTAYHIFMWYDDVFGDPAAGISLIHVPDGVTEAEAEGMITNRSKWGVPSVNDQDWDTDVFITNDTRIVGNAYRLYGSYRIKGQPIFSNREYILDLAELIKTGEQVVPLPETSHTLVFRVVPVGMAKAGDD